MRTNRYFWRSLIAAAALVTPSFADAQAKGTGGRGLTDWRVPKPVQILNVEPVEGIPGITNAPFAAEASTEFTQILSDGNRIEQRFTAALARDGHGRTRSEQEVAMLGPLVVLQKGAGWTQGVGRGGRRAFGSQGEPPRFVVITDPTEGTTYTLDDGRKEARRSRSKPVVMKALELKLRELKKSVAPGASPDAVVESLGTRHIEGVSADGIRSTTTIPAGEIGNLSPIQLVTERWFSKELQMAVLITRRDPRSGETVYRLTNVVRAEPPPDLFTVPSDYRVVDVNEAKLHDMKIELKKLEKAQTAAQP